LSAAIGSVSDCLIALLVESFEPFPEVLVIDHLARLLALRLFSLDRLDLATEYGFPQPFDRVVY